MNTCKSIQITLAAIAAGLALQLHAVAQTAPGTDTKRFPQAGEHPLLAKLAGSFGNFDKLDLDQAQRAQIKDVLKDNLPAMKPLFQQSIAEHRALQDAIHAVPVNENAIRTQSAKVAGLEVEIAIRRARLSAEIQTILRPEQIAELQKMKDARREKMDTGLAKAGKFLGE